MKSEIEKLESVHPDLITTFLTTGEGKGIPEDVQIFLKQLQWAAEIYEYERNITRGARQLKQRIAAQQKISLDVRTCMTRINQAISYFNVDCNVSIKVWVTDITYVPIWLNDNEYIFCYVSIITDAYTKEIISWYVGESLEAWCSVECLIKAFDTLAEEDKTGLIHHSDRGVQYVSAAYTSLLLDAGIKISMTESGDPKDNAIAERINNTLKNELFRILTQFW